MAGERGLELSAHAKANLLLRVLERRPDGFHDLQTLFVRLELSDRVEVTLVEGGSGIQLDVTEDPSSGGRGPAATVPEGRENLCWRAAALFRTEAGVESGVAIRLLKRIPAGAGLGGGSADAAAVLRGLQELHGRPLPDSRLRRLAGELGSDVPFALLDRPAALGLDRGIRLVPVHGLPPRPALLALSDRPVSTAEAYGWLDEDRAAGRDAVDGSGRGGGDGRAPLPEAAELSDWATIRSVATNDFEGPVFRRRPDLRERRDALAEGAAGPVLLCGSGSALLAVHEDPAARDDAARRLAGWQGVRLVRTRVAV